MQATRARQVGVGCEGRGEGGQLNGQKLIGGEGIDQNIDAH